MLIITSKPIDDLSLLQANEEVSTFEVEKLQDPLITSRWRSTTLFPYIEGQFDQAYTPTFWGLWYSNATKTDFARLRLADSQANLTSSPLVDLTDYLWPVASGFHGGVLFTTSDSVDFGNILDPTSNSFSVQIRLKRTNTGINSRQAGKKNALGLDVGWSLRVNTSDKLQFLMADGANAVGTTSDSIVSDTVAEMYTVVVDRSANNVKMYRGSTVQSIVGDTTSVGSLSNALNLYLSRHTTGTGEGEISDFRYWTKALSQVEISSNYDSDLDVVSPPANLGLYWRANEASGSTAVDESGNANDGTITGGTRINVDPTSYADLASWESVHQASYITNPVEASWFRIDFNFRGNTDGYVQGSKLFLAPELELRHDRGWNYTDQARGVHEVDFVTGGVGRGGGSNKRGVTFRLRHNPKVDIFGSFDHLIRDRREVFTVAAVMSTTESEYPMSYLFYGYPQRSGTAVNRSSSSDVMSTEVSVTEP